MGGAIEVSRKFDLAVCVPRQALGIQSTECVAMELSSPTMLMDALAAEIALYWMSSRLTSHLHPRCAKL